MIKTEKILISLSFMIRSKIRHKKYKNSEIKEIIEYMVTKIISNIICLSSIIILKNLLRIDNSIYAFLLSYIVLRSRFGGMHLKSERNCLIASVIIPIVVCLVINKLYIDQRLIVIIYLFIMTIFLKNKTVDNENNLLTKEQKEKFSKQGFILLPIVFVINYLLRNSLYGNGILFGALCAAIVNFIGALKNRT